MTEELVIDLIIEALSKCKAMKPKTPLYKHFDWLCPNCLTGYEDNNNCNYCSVCGQRIDWRSSNLGDENE